MYSTSKIKTILSNTNIYQTLFEHAIIFATFILKTKSLPKKIVSNENWYQ